MTRLKATERREQFVAAAVAVMAREGLERATTRRIAEEAGAPQGIFHYLFNKDELFREVVAAITHQIEEVVREAVDPSRGLAAAIEDGLRAFWVHVVTDDGLQLMQYELTIYARRTPGCEWLAKWQYNRYLRVAMEVLDAAVRVGDRPTVPLDQLARFMLAGLDGLVIQYEVQHDVDQSNRDLEVLIRAVTLLAGLETTSSPTG